jgi:hypothetical protein
MSLHDRMLFDGFTATLPIRSRGTFHLVSCRRVSDRRPVVVLFAPKPHDAARANAALRLVAEAHARIEHPLIAPSLGAHVSPAGDTYVVFDFPGVMDGVELVRIVADSGTKVPYAHADTLGTSVREALQAAHATRSETGESMCLRALSNGNILFAPDGRLALVGFGHNFATTNERGLAEGLETTFAAPEVATGGPPSPMGDYVALLLWMRSFLQYLDVLPMVGRIISGHLDPGDDELLRLMRFFEFDVIHGPAALRPPMEQAILASQRIRELLEVELDREGLRTELAALIARNAELPEDIETSPHVDDTPPSRGVLRMAPDAAWIDPPGGARVALGKSQRRVALALTDARRHSPGKPLDVWSLLESGWPGEKPVYEAAVNRVYVVVSRLRKAGLGGVIERFDEGYRIRPDVTIVVVG